MYKFQISDLVMIHPSHRLSTQLNSLKLKVLTITEIGDLIIYGLERYDEPGKVYKHELEDNLVTPKHYEKIKRIYDKL